MKKEMKPRMNAGERGLIMHRHPERTREGSGIEGLGWILREYAQDDMRAEAAP